MPGGPPNSIQIHTRPQIACMVDGITSLDSVSPTYLGEHRGEICRPLGKGDCATFSQAESGIDICRIPADWKYRHTQPRHPSPSLNGTAKTRPMQMVAPSAEPLPNHRHEEASLSGPGLKRKGRSCVKGLQPKTLRSEPRL